MINSDSAELPEIASKTYSNELIDSAREKATARLLSSNSSSKTRMQRGGGVDQLGSVLLVPMNVAVVQGLGGTGLSPQS